MCNCQSKNQGKIFFYSQKWLESTLGKTKKLPIILFICSRVKKIFYNVSLFIYVNLPKFGKSLFLKTYFRPFGILFFYSSEARPKAERSSELGWQKKKGEQKKKARRLVVLVLLLPPPILFLVKIFTFLSKFLPFSPSFNLQKLFRMFSTSIIYPKDILRKPFSQKSFPEKKNHKKLFIFFSEFIFFFRFIFFWIFFFELFFSIFFFL